MTTFISWLERHLGTCSWESHFGIRCPGCGMQTAFIELLKGQLVASIKIYPALMPMLMLFLFLFLHLLYNFRHGGRIIKILFIFTVCIMFIHYMLQVFTL